MLQPEEQEVKTRNYDLKTILNHRTDEKVRLQKTFILVVHS